jgi:monofunctional glycosyltransferase
MIFTILKWIKRLVFGLILYYSLFLIIGRFFNPIITVTQLSGLLSYHKLDRDYIVYSQMGQHIKKAVIASEDQNFYKHSGFDFKAIQKAYTDNNKGEKIKGASTISQQTAKNIFLWNGRSYVRKAFEVVFTFFIELLWSKDIILERYLNVIEMGQGVFGIEAAAQYYYQKPANMLSQNEAAMIASILPNPQKYDPKNPSTYLRKKQQWILKQMRNIP